MAFAKLLAPLDLAPARAAVAAALVTAPAALQRDLALATLSDRANAEAIVALIEKGTISARLLQDGQIAGRLRHVGLPDADARIKTLTAALPPADERVRGVVKRVVERTRQGQGSAAAGAEVFARNCATCHRLRGTGGLVGPQLDGVGQRGPERLLEDILDPNRNVDEAFRTTVATLADGRVVSGLRLRDDADDVVFADAAGREFRVPRSEIEETAHTAASPMPANMADEVGEAALPDLLAYLRERPAAPAP